MRTHSSPPRGLDRHDTHGARVRRVALIRPGRTGFSVVAEGAPRRPRGAVPGRLALVPAPGEPRNASA
jgi:hypothetical protein